MHLSGVLSWLCICTSLKCIEGHFSWRGFYLRLWSAIVHTWGYSSHLGSRKHDLRVLSASCAHMKVLRSFEVKMTWFEDVEYMLCTFGCMKVIWVQEDLIWGCWVQVCTFECIKDSREPNTTHMQLESNTTQMRSYLMHLSGLPYGEIGTGQLICSHSRCSPLKEGGSHQGPSNFGNACFRFTYRFSPTRTWSNTIIHVASNIGVVFLIFFLTYVYTS